MARIDWGTPVTRLDGTETTLDEHRGKVLLVVNTASACGFTPQYEALEALWRAHQFGHQEPGDEAEIGRFCHDRYDVTFPMHAKVEVNGKGAHPLFRQLTAAAPGILGTERIKWNFTKFLVDRDGTVVRRFGSVTTPQAIVTHLRPLLAARG